MGYIGTRMSENAARAYGDGLNPLSKWTKSDLIAGLPADMTGRYDFTKIKKDVLFGRFLVCQEWHHTGSYFARTDFYGIDPDRIGDFTADDYVAMVAASSRTPDGLKEKTAPEKIFALVNYVEWSGSRNYPKRNDVTAYGVITGDWFTSLTGTRKKVSGNWFSVSARFGSESEMLEHKNAADQATAAAAEIARKAAAEKRRIEMEKAERKQLLAIWNAYNPETRITAQKMARHPELVDAARELLAGLRSQRGRDYAAVHNDFKAGRIDRETYKARKAELAARYAPIA